MVVAGARVGVDSEARREELGTSGQLMPREWDGWAALLGQGRRLAGVRAPADLRTGAPCREGATIRGVRVPQREAAL